MSEDVMANIIWREEDDYIYPYATPPGESAAHDDEYTAPGHSYPLTVSPSICPHTFELQSMHITIDALRADNAELVESLHCAIAQACGGDGNFDSMGISDYADAIRLLASRGRMVIFSDVGRRVIARSDNGD